MRRYDAVPSLQSNVQINKLPAICFTPVASQFHPLCHVETETRFLPTNVLVTNQMAGLIILR